MSWTTNITDTQWSDWRKMAEKIAKQNERAYRLQKPSQSPADMASEVMEKLFKERVQPDSVEAWMRTAISRQYQDVVRKMNRRGGPSLNDMTDEEWEREMLGRANRSASFMAIKKGLVEQILATLSPKERAVLVMSAAGFDNHEIAHELGYASNRVVATRIKQITKGLQAELERVTSEI